MRLYRKANLVGHEWHKVTVERGGEEHKRIREWLDRNLREESFAYKSVITHMVILFSDLEGLVLARLMFDFTEKELRGRCRVRQ